MTRTTSKPKKMSLVVTYSIYYKKCYIRLKRKVNEESKGQPPCTQVLIATQPICTVGLVCILSKNRECILDKHAGH